MLGEQYVTTSSEAALIAHSHLVFAASRRACELAACPASSRQPAIPRRFAGGPSKLSTPQPHIVLIAIFSHSPRGLFAVAPPAAQRKATAPAASAAPGAPRALTNISPSLCLYPSSAYALLLLRLPRPTLSSARAADLKEHRGHFSGRAAGLARMQIVLNFLPDISGEPSRAGQSRRLTFFYGSIRSLSIKSAARANMNHDDDDGASGDERAV